MHALGPSASPGDMTRPVRFKNAAAAGGCVTRSRGKSFALHVHRHRGGSW